jgi:peptide/nickel transport system permease protein
MGVLGMVVLLCIFVPVFSPYDANFRDGALPLAPWGVAHKWPPHAGMVSLLGTDFYGRDFMTQLFVGGRMTLLVAFSATIAVVIIGAVLGSLAGYFGGWVDTVIMRGTDFITTLPLLPAYLIAYRIIKPARITEYADSEIPAIVGTLILVLILFGWMGICRMVRGSLLAMRDMAFVEAARALGAGHRRIIFKHLLPNAIGPIIVTATFAMGDFIIIEAVLTYFGLGLRNPPIASWGSLVSGGQNYAWQLTNLNPFEDVRPFLLLLPTFLILITVLSINYIGDALRDAMDPHNAGRA